MCLHGYCVCQSWLLSHPVTYISILGHSIFAAELARILVAPGVVDPTQAYHITGHANGVTISFMVDTGAAVSLIHEEIWKEITSINLGWSQNLI